MSLPASNRKAPSRAVIAATLLALGATSAAAQSAQSPYGFAQQQQFAAPYGYAQNQAPYGAPAGFPGYAVQPASTLNQPATQGYAAPAPQQPAYAAPQAPQGYGTAPQPFPGYGIPGGYPVPGAVGAPIAGFTPYSDPYGASSQWGQFAPSEPTYAPAERAPVATAPAPRATTTVAAAPAPAAPAPAPAAPAPIQSATVATTVASDYTYEVAPATGSTYVGTSAEFTTGADPYQAIPAQPAPQPTYTQQYEPAPQQYEPAPQQPAYTQQYEATASYPAPEAQETVNVGGYEYQAAAPQQPSADYYDLSAQTAAAAAAALSVAAAPQQQVVVAAPSYAAPVVPQGAHFVQVGAFVDPGRANNLVNQLGAKGEQAIIIPAQVRGKLYHRVRVLAANQRDARIVRDRIRNLGYYEARVVKG